MLLERVELDAVTAIVIRKNGDVLSTFLVDGMVAGAWDAPLRGRAVMKLEPFTAISTRHRGAVEREAESLLAWLRPDATGGEVSWKPA